VRELEDEEPGEDPYTTVTNGERFAPLHTAALALFADLADRYEVTVSQTFEQTPALSAIVHARRSASRFGVDGGMPMCCPHVHAMAAA
jgi:hypothetical protein